MKVLLIQPPLVQLNSPYPSGAYLSAFFKEMGYSVRWVDLSISLFYSIFSREGLNRLFDLSENKALEMADRAFKSGDQVTAFNLRRYVSCRENWCDWIDIITGILRGQQREKEHEFLFSPYAPRGNRMENFISGIGREPSVDDVRFLASYALADLADYITAVFDENFSLVRYAESLTVDESSFSEIEAKLDSPVMKAFYQPVLEKEMAGLEDFLCDDQPFLAGITVPFAGTFMPSLYTARFLKKAFSGRVYTVLGGGFVNTELRQAKDSGLSGYIDALSFDRGYGGFWDFLKNQENLKNPTEREARPLYKFRQFFKDKVIEPDWQGNKEIIEIENNFTRNLVPDFSDIDFSVYPRLCDDKNPMQRLWSDGSWIKAYLAHGCYWHKCAFCDTQLDYVCGYHMADVEKIYRGLAETAGKNHIYGLHFVDEALPPSSLKKFALLNAASEGQKLYYWGNVRFEKSFTYDLAALLAYGGLGGVSAGLEVATGDGLKNINKGTDIDSIVSACAAFKENGILVHAYMIYGFWNDTDQNIINSMETLRQFFEAGLLDSAFWHKFILTRNSRVMEEWKKGEHPELKPVFPKGKSIFAGNCLHFEGEKRFAKWGRSLDSALTSWMHGKKLEMNVRRWFDFEVPAPSVPKDLVEKAISRYEEKKSTFIPDIADREIFWLGSRLVSAAETSASAKSPGRSHYVWIYMQEMLEEKMTEDAAGLLWKLRPSASPEERSLALNNAKKSEEVQKMLQKLRGRGIVVL